MNSKFELLCTQVLILLIDRNIENNPGPTFEILKVVQGSFHEGNAKLGYTAAVQCACNSLYPLCLYTVKRVTVWTTCDLDYILENGVGLFKTRNINHALNVDELPQEVNVEGCLIRVTMLENGTGILNTVDQLNFLKVSHDEKLNTGIAVIFFINGYTFAIIWSKSGYFLCDSHSENYEGLITSDGTSILLKFKALINVQNYIEEVYMLLIYQMQYINIETECTDIRLLISSVKKIKHRAQNRG